MTTPDRVVLIGPSGSGKSELARRLAAGLDYEAVDTDAIIEQRIAMSIGAFFERFGEPAFRAIERQVLREACAEPGRVVATGGGVVLDPANWAAMRPGAVIVGLTAQPETLIGRVNAQASAEGEGAARPLLAGDPIARMRALLDVRGGLYSQVDVVIDTDGLSPDDVARRALQAVGERASAGAIPALSIDTPLQRSDLYVGRGTRALAGTLARQRWPEAGRCWIVTDETVARLWLSDVAERFNGAGFDVRRIVVPPGESSKSMANLAAILDDMTSSGVTRSDLVVALGGGVAGDLGGYAAAACLRGLPLVQIPTSLLAMVDSSVGGKTGVNTAAGKNLVGAFYQPGLVLIDPDFLETLSPEEYRSGMAEVVKHAWIQPATPIASDELLRRLNELESLDPIPAEEISEVVRLNVLTKHSVVQADERESGLRMILNFGHTAGHAIEANGYRYRHGEAVALGMLVAAHTAVAMDLLGGDRFYALEAMLDRAGLPIRFDGAISDVLAGMKSDKKNIGGSQRWILPVDEGGVEIRTDVDARSVEGALAAIGGR